MRGGNFLDVQMDEYTVDLEVYISGAWLDFCREGAKRFKFPKDTEKG